MVKQLSISKLWILNMVRIFLILIISAGIINPLTALAEEQGLTLEKMESKLSSVKNPFQSQLPVKKQEKAIAKKEPVKVKKPQPPKAVKPDGTVKAPTGPAKTEVIPEKEIPPLPNLTINGVIWDSERPQAIINGHIIDIGDAILQVEITDIRKTEIEGIYYGKPVTIKTQRSAI